ncbi:hypothetical protein KR009_009715 [Drosophila setifemur]|nr:hypothetical protein KR009_009715 [Drosophila setifemur]
MTTNPAETESPNKDPAVWRRWCRLCAKDNPKNRNVYAMDVDQESSWTSMLAMAIGKYFWVDIKKEDELSNYLCADCFTLMECLIEFSERVRRVQTLFNRLMNSKPDALVDFEELRTDCGLVTDEWKHVMSRAVEPLPVERVQGIVAIEQVVAECVVETTEKLKPYSIKEEEEVQPIPMEDYSEDSSHIIEESEAFDDFEDSSQDECARLEIEAEVEPEETEELEDVPPENGDLTDEPAIYKCSICSKPYKKPRAYQRHMQDVHNQTPLDLPQLDCNQCGVGFSTVTQLHAHYRSHLPAKEKQDNCCPHCERKFTTAGTLKRHVEGVHKQIKPYVCDLCGKTFKYITGLKDHKLVHTDDCPFECPVCQRRFKNKARLKIHSDTHSANIYECGVCGLKLKTRRTFNKHKLCHSDERQYKCDVCGSAFKRSKTLKAHLILHTGIRPYKCNFCGRDFSNGSNCRSHKRQAHPKELAEEEARGVSRSTLLPLLDELTKA